MIKLKKYAVIACNLDIGQRVATRSYPAATKIKRALSKTGFRGESSVIHLARPRATAWLVINVGIPPHLVPICHNCRVARCVISPWNFRKH
ncbi:MAG: hypothetical protein JWN34_2305 [Bryobacterales bacterium]|nr:hypothetical protein [Bryobacterales bacterium]